jgi:hypothetical protein
MAMGYLAEAISLRWLRRRKPEPEFPIPDTRKDDDTVPPAVLRHLRVIGEAMARNDHATVGNRQRRLAKLGVEVPTKPSHVADLLRKYDAPEASD